MSGLQNLGDHIGTSYKNGGRDGPNGKGLARTDVEWWRNN